MRGRCVRLNAKRVQDVTCLTVSGGGANAADTVCPMLGLPCLPSPAEISLGGTGVGLVHVDGKTTTFGREALLTIAVYSLAIALLISISFNCKRSQRETQARLRRPSMRAPAPGPYGDLGEPLIEEEDAVSESKEDDEHQQEKTADVQFV